MRGSMSAAATVERMAGLRSVGLAVVMVLAGATAPSPAVARDVIVRQSPMDADYYLRDASGNWAAPRCIGDGVSGPRVQPVFVYRKGTANRYERFRTTLQRSTDLTTGVFERSSAARRTVRWVHDASCRPVIWQVAVPTARTHDLVSLRRYLEDRQPRFRRSDRVYSLWVDSTTSPSWSGLGDDRWSASWSSSWGFVWVDAHELVHALGAIWPGAPHSTGKAHCYDGYDLMCYSDGGPGWRNVTVCPAPQARYRLDCGQDDYFAVAPRRGSWLARHPRANVANSRFLAKVPPRVLPTEPAAPVEVTRLIDRVTWANLPDTRYDVGLREPGGSLRWLAQDVVSGEYPLARVGPESRVFVRAVNDAGFSPWVRAGG